MYSGMAWVSGCKSVLFTEMNKMVEGIAIEMFNNQGFIMGMLTLRYLWDHQERDILKKTIDI